MESQTLRLQQGTGIYLSFLQPEDEKEGKLQETYTRQTCRPSRHCGFQQYLKINVVSFVCDFNRHSYSETNVDANIRKLINVDSLIFNIDEVFLALVTANQSDYCLLHFKILCLFVKFCNCFYNLKNVYNKINETAFVFCCV